MIVRILAVALMLQFIILDCGPSSPSQGVTHIPQFRNCTSLANGLFVAYESPNPVIKPDTIRYSFSFTGMQLSAITCAATIDSGTSWITIGDIHAQGDTAAFFEWVPRNEPEAFDYCGKKTGTIKLTDTASDTFYESAQFTIIGSAALYLDKPSDGDTVPFEDTIVIRYVTNSDMVSNVQVFFACGTEDDWVEIIGTTSRIIDDSPIRILQTLLIPSDITDHLPEENTIPIRFLLRDYNSPEQSGMIISGFTTLQRP